METVVQPEAPKPWPFKNSPEEVGDVAHFYSKDGMGEIDIPDTTGHTKKIWDSKDPVSVDDARRSFEFFTKEQGPGKNYSAFAVDKKGEKTGEALTTFDPNLEKIIFIKPLAGG